MHEHVMKTVDEALDREFARTRGSNREKAYRIANIIRAEQVYCLSVERAHQRFMDAITVLHNG